MFIFMFIFFFHFFINLIFISFLSFLVHHHVFSSFTWMVDPNLCLVKLVLFSFPACCVTLVNFFRIQYTSTIIINLSVFSPHDRTCEDLEIIYEELLHIKALSHLSTMVKKELASVLIFESHEKAGTVCKFNSKEMF